MKCKDTVTASEIAVDSIESSQSAMNKGMPTRLLPIQKKNGSE